uniref:Colicin V production protein n=1 Tax=Magnetococcus massalia (strain MO-1) TaxID=451514 RepID=A0A1S7LP49_MAGMO|nr:Conserved protein of unknown function. Containing colicin V production relative domain [Candidatus Magnetococcus massalia]
MIWFDYLLIFVFGFVLLLASMRGFLREILSLTGWLLAFITTTFFSGRMAQHLTPHLDNPQLVRLTAISIVFFTTLAMVWGLGYFLRWAVQTSELTWKDRTLAASFGLVRGVFIVLISFAVIMSFGGPPEQILRHSIMARTFAEGAWRLSVLQPNDSILRVFGDTRPTRIQVAPAPSWKTKDSRVEAWLNRPVEAPPAMIPKTSSRDSRRL